MCVLMNENKIMIIISNPKIEKEKKERNEREMVVMMTIERLSV